jgi:hypothetical protein
LTAETIGGICSMSPTSVLAAASTCSPVIPLMSWVAVTSPAASRVEVSVPRAMTAS